MERDDLCKYRMDTIWQMTDSAKQASLETVCCMRPSPIHGTHPRDTTAANDDVMMMVKIAIVVIFGSLHLLQALELVGVQS